MDDLPGKGQEDTEDERGMMDVLNHVVFCEG